MHSSQTLKKSSQRLPEWLRIKLPADKTFSLTAKALENLKLNTVCNEARCPNKCECYSRGTATFMILGQVCTRTCSFCNVNNHAALRPDAPDADEPRRLALAAKELALKYVVITSVTRDDLQDGGAAHFAACIRAVRKELPHAGVEVLIPDFNGDPSALRTVLDSRPDVLNHNVETVPSLYPTVRPQADFKRSIELLRTAAGYDDSTHGKIFAKSGFMLGLGETDEEVRDLIRTLAENSCSIITIGQYLRPSRKHPEPARYAHPDEFEAYAEFGNTVGVRTMYCGPLVRSSHNAGEVRQSVGESRRKD